MIADNRNLFCTMLRTFSLMLIVLGLTSGSYAEDSPASQGSAVEGVNNATDEGTLHDLGFEWTDHRGKQASFANLAGSPVVVSLFYASCQYSCPLIVSRMKAIERGLNEEAQQQVRFLLVTIDPKRDSVEVLAKTAETHKVGPQWSLARIEPDAIRTLSAVLGFQYQALENGEFHHSFLISVLDKKGHLKQVTNERTEAQEIVELVNTLSHEASP